MMNILSATFATFDHSSVILETEDYGQVWVVLQTDKDMSGGWLPIYAVWSETNETLPYQEPPEPEPEPEPEPPAP
jgi:photosystem II stability/assembly factor-like uncharacterized protein